MRVFQLMGSNRSFVHMCFAFLQGLLDLGLTPPQQSSATSAFTSATPASSAPVTVTTGFAFNIPTAGQPTFPQQPHTAPSSTNPFKQQARPSLPAAPIGGMSAFQGAATTAGAAPQPSLFASSSANSAEPNLLGSYSLGTGAGTVLQGTTTSVFGAPSEWPNPKSLFRVNCFYKHTKAAPLRHTA